MLLRFNEAGTPSIIHAGERAHRGVRHLRSDKKKLSRVVKILFFRKIETCRVLSSIQISDITVHRL
jgi:hypothetical protein